MSLLSSCAIAGTGAQRGREALNRRTIHDLRLAGLVTVPAAAGLGILAFVLLR